MPILPKVFGARSPSQRASSAIRVSPVLLEVAEEDTDGVLRNLQTSASGISDEEAIKRREQYGPNVIVRRAAIDCSNCSPMPSSIRW